MTSFTDVEYVVRTIAQTAVDNEKEFGDLDAVVGDGDFGYSLARGFEIVLQDWESYDRTDIGTFLKKIAVVITSRIGGTSGPIWGTAFLRAGAKAAGKSELTGADVVLMLRAAAEGISARGKAVLGEKTLLDALIPATDTIEAEVGRGASAAEIARAAAATTLEAAEATKALEAKRGRASYTGERSIGSVDAGAMALAVIAEQIARTWPPG
ncbi:MAG TPA: dihydroxyacetone kinase subunit DhaL [Nakamurella sp.]|jgi:dihydroxyacetone kinase-like protein